MAPRYPMRGGFPPQMMNSMMRPPSYGPMMGRGGMGPMMGGMPRGPQGKAGGGLLAKLLGKGNSSGAQSALGAAGRSGSILGAASRSAGAASSGGGGIMQALTNPTALNGFLTNTQKVLNTAQQIGPMVQQYGPIVKNIPAMWKLYRGLKDLPDADETNEVEKENTEEAKTRRTAKKKRTTKQNSNIESVEETKIVESGNTRGQSVPKLYV